MIEGVIDEEEKIFFMIKPNLFTLGTITLLEPRNFNVEIFSVEVDTEDLRSIFHTLKDIF
jgi:hypothetical protein